MSVKIQAAIFDIGNVLLPFDYMRSANRLIAENSPPVPPDRARIIETKARLETGQIGRSEFLAIVRPEFNHTGPESDFLAIWEDIFEPNQPINQIVEALADQMPLYLLSNISDIHREFIHRTYPIFQKFRDGVYSYEVGMMKPDPKIFHLAAERFGVVPSQTLYVDDMPENVQAAKEAGFRVVHYDHKNHADGEQAIRGLAGLPG